MPGEMADTPACPICGKPARAPHRPFCSTRCADIDLGRWFTGSYRVPAEPIGADEDDPDAEPTV